MRIKILLVALVLGFAVSCGDETLPKPAAQLALQYKTPAYKAWSYGGCPYTFMKNTDARVEYDGNCSAILHYPKMNGALYLTYRPVEGNLRQLLGDAQKLTYEHVIKADEIFNQPYVDEMNGVYGMFYDVSGNAASQSQFYVTDSLNNFLTGSIYFNTEPNYDSILPAAAYLKKDIKRILETLRWREKK